jgi:hypothetical protein
MKLPASDAAIVASAATRGKNSTFRSIATIGTGRWVYTTQGAEKRLWRRRARPAGALTTAAAAMAAATRTAAGLGRSARAGGERASAARRATTGAGHAGGPAAASPVSAASTFSPPGTRRSGHPSIHTQAGVPCYFVRLGLSVPRPACVLPVVLQLDV